MNKEFKLYQEIIKYDRYIRRYVVVNIPAVHRDLKIHMLDESYKLERFLLESQYTKGNIREKHIVDMLVSISMLNVLTDELLEFCPKLKRQITSSIAILMNIKNMTYAWKNSLIK